MRFPLKSLLFLPIISTTSFGQILNDILDGSSQPDPSLAFESFIMQTMVPQNGTPDEVVVWKCNGIDHNNPNCFDGSFPIMSSEESLPELYAYYPQGRDTLELPIFEEGAYLILCLSSSGDEMGESTLIMMNDNFITNGFDTGYYGYKNGLVVSTKPLRIGRDQSEFVCFN